MTNLNNTKLISIEIGEQCNLANEHHKCPISVRKHNKENGSLTIKDITSVLQDALKLGFQGMVGFQYYNEPMLYLDRIEQVMKGVPEIDYLLWTNGTLLDRDIENNEMVRLFKQVVITCYNKKDMPFYEALKEYYKNIHIVTWELDNRKEMYEKGVKNIYGCMRPVWEIPIDYYGNIHLCCRDWNESYRIGNVKKDRLEDILNSKAYQTILRSVYKDYLDKNRCPDLCKRCDNPMYMPNIGRRFESIAKRMQRKQSVVVFPDDFVV